MNTLNYDEIKSGVKKWLENQGFPLEMKVAKILIDKNFGLRQSFYFNDIEENKSRELDILAYKEIDDSGYPLTLNFLIECKWSDRPFVILKYPQRNDDSYVTHHYEINEGQTNFSGRRYVEKLREDGSYYSLPLVKIIGSTGYSMLHSSVTTKKSTTQQTSKRSSDLAYESLIVVTKAMLHFKDLVNKTAKIVRRDSIGSVFQQANIIFPVVVLDALIYESFITNKGDIHIEQIEKSIITWNNPNIGNIPILIYSLSSLPELAEDINKTIDLLKELGTDWQ